MAEFCQQCSIELFGRDEGDLKGLSTPAETAKGLYAVVICEHCGFIQVDHTGRCVSPDCFENHGEKKE